MSADQDGRARAQRRRILGIATPGVYARLARMWQAGGCAAHRHRAPCRAVATSTVALYGYGPARAPLAQSAERLHGKEKVYGSIP